MADNHARAAAPAFDLVARLLAADGVATHPFHARLLERRVPARDLSDAVHGLCAVHGHHPDLIGIVAGEVPDAWVTSFAAERAALARLVVAAGPLPSTPGQASAQAALAAGRHALEMLARSERAGVGLGAAAALLLDWRAVRAVLDAAADRFGVTCAPTSLPDPDTVAAALAGAGERAVAFGAQQLFAQHRGLFGLLEARASARDA